MLSTLLFSLFLAARYLALIFLSQAPAGNFWPTIIFSGVLLILSVFLYITGILASVLAANRKLSEEILYRLRKKDANQDNKKGHSSI